MTAEQGSGAGSEDVWAELEAALDRFCARLLAAPQPRRRRRRRIDPSSYPIDFAAMLREAGLPPVPSGDNPDDAGEDAPAP